MISWNPRCVPYVLPLLGAMLLAGLARGQAPSAKPDVLKPFEATPAENAATVAPANAPAAVPKELQALAGAWKGTFTHTHPDKTTGETTYLVKVDPLAPSITVVPIVSASAVSVAPLPANLQPLTAPEMEPANWDGRMLKQRVNEETVDGDTRITTTKVITFAAGKDKKHAQFAYEIAVTSVTGPKTVTVNNRGSGILSRAK